jgi:K+-transporting ATPase KdpF subunit
LAYRATPAVKGFADNDESGPCRLSPAQIITLYGGVHDRFTFCARYYPVFRCQWRLYRPLCAPDGGKSMTVLYLLAGVIALLLLVYLFVALLKPELFG